MTWALFVKIGGDWKFSGFTEFEEKVCEFEENVMEDIDGHAETGITPATEAYFAVQLEEWKGKV